jgi:alpha-ketoglutarate-dependent taurine dioxygenase
LLDLTAEVVEEEIFDFLNGLIYLPQFAVSMSWSVTGIVGRCGSRK